MKKAITKALAYKRRLSRVIYAYSGYTTWLKVAEMEGIHYGTLWRWIVKHREEIVITSPSPKSKKCPYCDWHFQSRKGLMGHVSGRHPGGTLPDCSGCGIFLTPENRAHLWGGTGNLCQACAVVARRTWRKTWKDRNPLTPESREIVKARNRARNHRLRIKIVEAYGGKCACCGEDDPSFLSIDHVNNDGREHRKALKGQWLYDWLEKNNFPKDNFQLLCYNCNYAKYRFTECPHQWHARYAYMHKKGEKV